MEPVSHTAKNNSQILAQIEDMISKLNGEGKEGDIKGLGHTIAELYDITVLEQFIIRLCDSGSPITAPITIKSLHHDEEPRLKALVIRKLSDDSWTLYDKIIALLMFEEYDILTEIIDSVNVDRTLHESINRALQYFIERSEYTPVFGLIYTIAQCRHRVNLLKHFYNFELNQHYIEKNKDLVHKSARCIYENKAYDSLFYFCKNFKLLKSLKTILQKEPRILEEEFVGLGTMNGIRLAYRVLQNEYRNDEQALKVIISRITDIPRNDEVRYMHFNFLMKLILIQKRVDEETRQQLIHMGEVKILKRNKHGIITLGRCLETVLLSQGMQSYKEFVEILGVNHIFTFKNEIPEVIPYRIYEISLEGVSNVSITVQNHKTIGETLKALMDDGIRLMRELGIPGSEVCWYCNQSGGTEKVQVNEAVVYMHNGCIESFCQKIGQAAQEFHSEKKNYGRGFVGALLGAIIGAIPWVIVYLLGYVVAALGILIGFAAQKGYEIMGGKPGKGKAWIVLILVIVVVVVAHFIGDTIELYKLFEEEVFTPPQNVSKLTVLPVQLLMDIMSISS